MLTDQGGGGNRHAALIQLRIVPANALSQQCHARGLVMDNITVIAPAGGKTRMKIIINFCNPVNTHIRWQVCIGTTNPALLVANRIAIKMNNLAGRMHPRVRPACTDHAEFVISYL